MVPDLSDGKRDFEFKGMQPVQTAARKAVAASSGDIFMAVFLAVVIDTGIGFT